MQEHERIAFAGDWHANTGWARRAVAHAKDQGAQAMVHLGDYGWNYMNFFIRDMESMLRKAGLSLYFVDGNHEDFTRLHSFPLQPDGLRKISARVFHLPRGLRWSWGGVSFLACGGGVSVDRHRRVEGRSWWPEEQLSPADIQACQLAGQADVLISHDCPAGVPIPNLDKTAHWFPAEAIAESQRHRVKLLAVARTVTPKLIFHGHYDRDYNTVADLGWGPVGVRGLDRDRALYDPVEANVHVCDVAELRTAIGG